MKRLFSFVILTLATALTVHAQTAPDAAELTKLLNDFLAGASRNDVAMHDRFWAEDVIYTGSAGRRRGKADIMKDVRSAPAPKPGDAKTTYTAEDVRIQQYGNTAIVAFRLVGTTEKDGKTEVAKYSEHRHFSKAQRQMAGRKLASDEGGERGRKYEPLVRLRSQVILCGTLRLCAFA